MTVTSFDTTSTFNRISNQLLPVFMGKLLPILFLIIITILYSRKLTYYEYGQFQTLWIYNNIISVIVSFGLSSVILSTSFDYFITFFQKHRQKIIVLYSIGAVATFTFFYLTTHYFTAVTKLILVAFVLLQIGCTLTDTLLIRNNLLRLYVWLNLVYSVLFFSIHLYFYYGVFNLNHLIFCVICLSVLKAAFILVAGKKNTSAVATTPPVNFVNNWLFTGVNEVAGIIARWLDKIFLFYLLAPAEFAIFFNGAFEIPLFGILISTMENIMLTHISADIGNRQAAKNIFRESFKILSLIAFPLFFFLLTMHSEAFAIIFKNKYDASIPVFLISIFIIPVRITHYGVILQCYGQSKKNVLGAMMDIGFSLLLMFILYPVMGTRGVALAIVVSTWLQAGFYLWQSAVVMQVNIRALVPVYFLIRLSLALAGLFGILYYAKQYFTQLTSLTAVFLFTGFIIGGGLLYYFKSNRQSLKLPGNNDLPVMKEEL
ncbi:MAG: hypothetical protein ABI707_00085 [Ferruginibacter sp.]